jgi:tripartite-type tricarboxylate transporter receptor subunit TctC
MPERREDISRRRILKTTGALAATGAIAGCSGGGGGDSGGGDGDSGGDGGGDSGGDGGSTDTSTATATEMSYPDRPIEMIIPYGTGGGFNYYTRLVSQYMQEDYLPVAVQPQNVTPDVAGHNQLYRVEPDGYTAGVTSVSSMSKAQVLRDEANFDLREMTTFPRIAGTVECIAVGTHTDIENGQQLIDAMSAGELNCYGESTTGGSILDLVALGAVGGVYSADRVLDNFVQFDGLSTGIAAMRREEVDVVGSPLGSMLQYVESGDVRIITTMTSGDPPERAPEGTQTLSDLPVDDPAAVTGFLGVEFDRVFAGPPDIPEERAQVLREAMANAIQDEDLIADAEENDRVINFASSEEADQAIDDAVSAAEDNRELLQRLFGN